jgi:glycosyltransferase involved in cell wall biosynthesis
MIGLAGGMGVPVFVERLVHWIPGPSAGPLRRRLRHARRFLGTLPERVRAVERLIRDRDISVVYTNTITCAEGAIAARRTGRPHVWHVHEQIRGNRDLSPLARPGFSEKALYSLSSRVVFCSRALEKGYPSMKGKGVVVHNAVPRTQQVDRRSARERLVGELGVASDSQLVAVVGGLQPGKDIPSFLVAAERLSRSFPKAVFLIVGTGPEGYAGFLRRRIRDLGLETRAIMLGWREDAADILAGIDVLAVSSRQESFGLTAAEAMAAGTPVVATRLRGARGNRERRRFGLLVPVGDPAADGGGNRQDPVGSVMRDGWGGGVSICRERFGPARVQPAP